MKAPFRFHSLDVLRGVAALAVVLCHWKFWLQDAKYQYPKGFDTSWLPLHSVLFLFYEAGQHAVVLFFCLSGFIFFWLYRDGVATGRVDARAFVVARFSRLYPLHFAALLIVAVGQSAYSPMQGSSFVFAVNDAPNFLKHLLIVPLWDRHRNYTFNGPVWTLGVEVFLYTTFFLAARWATLRPGGVVLLLVVASQMAKTWSVDIGDGMAAFYMGGVAYIAFERVRSTRVEQALRILLAALWPFTAFYVWNRYDVTESDVWWIKDIYAIYILFPATVLYLALVEARLGEVGRRWSWLGEISYSSYLLHFPLMLLLAIVLKSAGVPFTIALSPWALLAFVAMLVGVSLASYRLFESPVQEWIRSRLGAPGSVALAAKASP